MCESTIHLAHPHTERTYREAIGLQCLTRAQSLPSGCWVQVAHHEYQQAARPRDSGANVAIDVTAKEVVSSSGRHHQLVLPGRDGVQANHLPAVACPTLHTLDCKHHHVAGVQAEAQPLRCSTLQEGIRAALPGPCLAVQRVQVHDHLLIASNSWFVAASTLEGSLPPARCSALSTLGTPTTAA